MALFYHCLCRKNDPDRAPKFFKALDILSAQGIMGDLDDGPEQTPLSAQDTAMRLLPSCHFNLVITHNINGEYTRHRRHEEVSRAVIQLWHKGKLVSDELWTFAYEDGRRSYFPKPVSDAPVYNRLPVSIWDIKYGLITDIYGFKQDSWEAQTTGHL